MVSIVSGNSLGLNLSSLAALGQHGLGPAASPGTDAWVNVATGNLVLQARDELLAGRGADAATLRTYNSQGLLNDADNGDNWSNGAYLQPLALSGTRNSAGSTLRRTDADGSVATYTWDAVQGRYQSTDGAGAHDAIVHLAAEDQYEWREGSTGVRQRYQASGAMRLLSTRDEAGNVLAYGYDAAGRLASATTANGEATVYGYAGNQLESVRTVTADGVTTTRVRYGYDGSNRLATVTVDLTPADGSVADGATYVTRYTYDGTSQRVTRIERGDGTSTSFGYVAWQGQYRVASITDGLGRAATFAYSDTAVGTAGWATATDALGRITRYDTDAQGRLTAITSPGGIVQAFAYDGAGNLERFTDGTGQVTTRAFDERGNELLRRDAVGNTLTRTFDSADRVLTETTWRTADLDGAGPALPAQPLTTRYVYLADGADRRGALAFVISAEGRITEHRYDSFGYGQRVATLDHLGARYPVGSLAADAAPSLAELRAWLFARGSTQARRTDFAWDARGELQSSTAYASVDAAGNGVADGTQAVTRYVRDAGGRLLQTVDPSGGSSTYTHDGLGRLLTATDALGNTTVTQYQDAARRTVTTDAAGAVTTRAHDAAGQLVSQLQSSAAGTLGETKYWYDAAGQLRMTQDPVGNRHWMLYDPDGRKVADVDGNGTLTEYRYDATGRVVFKLALQSRITTSVLLAGSEPATNVTLATLGAHGRTYSTGDIGEFRNYDAAGRLVREGRSVANGAIAVTEHAYDAAGRLLQSVRHANTASLANVVAASGSMARPTASAADRITRHFHDADGLQLGRLDAEGYLTRWQYDDAGRVVEQLAHATATDIALRPSGTLEQLTPAASPDDQRQLRWYDGHGRLVAELDAEDFFTERVYDAAGRETMVVRYATRAAAAAASQTPPASWRPTSSAADQATRRSYDATGRLAEEIRHDGVVTRYTYDSQGRLVSSVSAAGTAEQRTLLARHDAYGRLVGELTGEGAALLVPGMTQAQVDAVWAANGITHSYDAASRRIRTQGPASRWERFFHDADGALLYTVNSLGEVREHRYDTLGRLTDTIAYTGRISTATLGANATLGDVQAALSSVANASADRRTTVTYAGAGLVGSTADGQGNVTTYAYNGFGEETQITRAGLLTQYGVDRRGLRTGSIADPGGLKVATSQTLDAFGRVVRTVDANGVVHDQSYDRLGRVVLTRDPLLAQRTTTYDAFDRVLTQVDALGRITRYVYDAATRATTVTTPEGIQTTTSRNRHGQVVSVRDGNGNLTSWQYDRNGRLLSEARPIGTTSHAYDAAGRLLLTLDGAGGRVTYGYDAADRVLTRVVYAGSELLVTSYQYDGQGRKVTVTDPMGVATTYQYDRDGRVLRQTVDPGGLYLQTTWTYDARGDVLTVTDPAGSTTRYTYDALGRRVREQVDPAGLNLQRSWTYDAMGNVLTATDAAGGAARFVHDAAGRLAWSVGPEGQVTQRTHDAEGREVRVRTYAAPIVTSTLPARPTAADLQARVVPNAAQDEVEHRVYDKDGRLAATVDGMGAVVRYIRDANGNVTQRTSYASRLLLGVWTPCTLPAPWSDPTLDEQLVTVYDAANRAIYTVDGVGAVVAQAWDAAGRLVRRTAYATTIAPATAPAGIPAAVTAIANAQRDQVEHHRYDTAGRRILTIDGTGAAIGFQYDRSGNLVKRTAYATAVAANGQPAASSLDRFAAMAYDKANRLVFEVDTLRAVTEYAYDAAGRVVRRTQYANALASVPSLGSTTTAGSIRSGIATSAASDRTTRHGYDAAGRQVLAIDATGAVTEKQYDGAGRVTASIGYANLVNASGLPAVPTLAVMRPLVTASANDRTSRKAWDSAGRLIYTVDPLGAVQRMQYDAVGRVTQVRRYARAIAPTTPATVAAIGAVLLTDAADQVDGYAYDAAGNRTSHTDANGVAESYTWDGLGRRLGLLNRLGRAWAYVYDAAGRLVQETSPTVAIDTPLVSSTGNVTGMATETAEVVTRLAYDALGNLVMRTEAAGRTEQRTTRYEYDAAGRQVRVIHPTVGVYDPAADAVSTNGATGVAERKEQQLAPETLTTYNLFGDAVANRDVAGAVTRRTYDAGGRLLYEVDALGYVAGHFRNAFGEVTRLVRHGAAPSLAAGTLSTAQVASALGAAGLSHAQDRELLTAYDRAGRAEEVAEPLAFVHDAMTGLMANARKTTRIAYNAFSQQVQVRTLAGSGERWSDTYRYYDKAGREVASVDALGYVTGRTYDVLGRATKVREYATAAAAGTWSLASFSTPGVSADDREVTFTWDRLDRKTGETRRNVEHSTGSDGTSTRGDLTTSYGYDALGRLTRTTDAAGQSTVTFYDVLGRVTAVSEAPLVSAGGSSQVPLTRFRHDAFGNVVQRVEYAAGATSVGASTAVTSSGDRTTYTRYDSHGRVVQVTDALGNSEYFSLDAHGRVAKKWQTVTASGEAGRTLFEVNTWDAAGRLVQTVTPASTSVLSGGQVNTVSQQVAGVVTVALAYNAFGEMISRGMPGSAKSEYFDYDTAGRLWRTNEGDGIDRIRLYDAQGNLSADIRSSGSGRDDRDLRTFADARAAAERPDTRRTDYLYDALGRLTAQRLPERKELQGGVSVQRPFVAASIASSAAPLMDEWGPTGWQGGNSVQLQWPSLQGLGSGDIRVTLEYRARTWTSGGGVNEHGAPIPVVVRGGELLSHTATLENGDAAAAGTTVTWSDPAGRVPGGVERVTRVLVHKKDVNGLWRVVLDQAPGVGANVIDVAAPADARAGLTLELRSPGGTWWTAGLLDFGAALRFDARGLGAGSYEYRATVTPPGQAARVVGSGTLSLSLPPLANISTPIGFTPATHGVLGWASPGGPTGQAFRYRPAGSVAPWSSLAVAAQSAAGQDGVDVRALAAGTYEYELLWSDVAQGLPTSHATGRFTITAGQPPQWVPPVNLPPVTGLSLGRTTVGYSVAGTDEDGYPTYTGGTEVSALVWPNAGVTAVEYRVAGGSTWASLPIDNRALRLAEDGSWIFDQKAPLPALPAGTYEFRILAGSPPTRQATATLTVYPRSPDTIEWYWAWVPVQRLIVVDHTPIYEQRSYTQTVPVYQWQSYWELARDENGYPVQYDDGTYMYVENRYYVQVGTTTQTVYYWALVGYSPVYARDEWGNLVYATEYEYQQRQRVIPGTTPPPSLQVTTPPYTPGYWTAGTPAQYASVVTTIANSTAVSSGEGAVLNQSAAVQNGDLDLRPLVQQKVDRWGNVVELTDARSASWKTTYRYNANDQVVSERRPDPQGGAGAGSPEVRTYYDKLGRQVAVRDARGLVNGQRYDARGNVVEELRADWTRVTHRYDALGQRVATVDARGKVTTYSWDKGGRMVLATHPAVNDHDLQGGMAVVHRGTLNLYETWTYDSLGRKVGHTNGNQETTRYAYDLRGNLVESWSQVGFDRRQQVRSAFDAQGRKVAEANANGHVATWSYDYFGRLDSRVDLGGARYEYTYDNARQLVRQTSDRGQSIRYGYDAAGQLLEINDLATGKVTRYAYDAGGRRLREKVVHGGITYQDNRLGWDALGRLRDVADGRVHVAMDYDAAGNRTRVATYVNYLGVGGETTSATERWFQYDAMNRQVVVDAVDAAGNLGTQGHRVTYDANGNRTGDTWWGERVLSRQVNTTVGTDANGDPVYSDPVTQYYAEPGYISEWYEYDAMNRLTQVVRDGKLLDQRQYDGAGRVLASGPLQGIEQGYADVANRHLPPGEANGREQRVNQYDALGRLVRQQVKGSNGELRTDTTWSHDAVGNATGWQVNSAVGGYTNTYTTSVARYDGYVQTGVSGTSTVMSSGTSTQRYDVNGHLVAVRDPNQAANNRNYINDAQGRALHVAQDRHAQRQLIANDEVLGTYGVAAEAVSGTAHPTFGNQVDFDFGYSRISAVYPAATPGAYQVKVGDALQGIARAAYGDADLWYRIAEANGLSRSSDLKVGQTLNIPNRVGTSGNHAGAFKPYDPGRLLGDTHPAMFMPAPAGQGGGCGGVGKLVMAVVAVAVTLATAGAMSGAAAGFFHAMAAGANVIGGAAAAAGSVAAAIGMPATLAIAGAAGSIASQVAGLATGDVQKFNWKAVALSAVGGGISAQLPISIPGSPTATVIARTAVANALTQGVGVVTGLQQRFDWRGVAASAVGAGVGFQVGEALGLPLPDPAGGAAPGAFMARSFAKSMASGLTAAVMRGGKVAVQQVAVDAFGNALGSSLAEASTGVSPDSIREISANSTARLGQLGSGTYGVSDIESLTVAGSPVQDVRAAHAIALPDIPSLDSDEYDRMGTPREVAIAGIESARGAWGIAQSIAASGASIPTINRIKNQLLALNPELASGVQKGQRYYLPSADAPENVEVARGADREYQAGLASRMQVAMDLTPHGSGTSIESGARHLFEPVSTGISPAMEAGARLGATARAQAHVLGFYEAGAGAVEAASYTFGLAGAPESRAAWAQQTAKATLEFISRVGAQPKVAISAWFDDLTGNDPAAIRGATAQGAGFALAVAGGAVTGRVAMPSAGLRTSAVISAPRAEAFLRKSGVPASVAKDFVSSFDGPITARLVRPGEDFSRYTDVPQSTGSFLSKTTFANPAAAVAGLYLGPYGNGATVVQSVSSTRRSIVLEGGIANGGAAIRQTLVIDRDAFKFGTGVRY